MSLHTVKDLQSIIGACMGPNWEVSINHDGAMGGFDMFIGKKFHLDRKQMHLGEQNKDIIDWLRASFANTPFVKVMKEEYEATERALEAEIEELKKLKEYKTYFQLEKELRHNLMRGSVR